MSINIILAEEMRYPIGSFVDKVKKQFPSSSTLYVNRNNVQEISKVLKSSPLLTEGWLVLVTLRDVPDHLIREYNEGNNVVVYIVRNKGEMHEVARMFMGENLPYKVVNNLDPSKSDVNEYIMKELKVDRELATYIARRHNYYLPKVSESVEILKDLPKITKDAVKKYTERSADLSYNSLFDYIIGVDEEVSETKVNKLISRYIFGVDYLVKFISKRFTIYLNVFDEVLRGKLSLENYKEYYEVNKSALKDVNEYTLRRAIEAVSSVSYEKLYYLAQLYERENEKGSTSVISLMGLLRLSKH